MTAIKKKKLTSLIFLKLIIQMHLTIVNNLLTLFKFNKKHRHFKINTQIQKLNILTQMLSNK